MDMSFGNLGTPLSVPSQPDPVEEQHLQELERHLHTSPVQPQQHDTLHQSPQNINLQQQRTGVSVIQPYLTGTGLTPQVPTLMQPQTPVLYLKCISVFFLLYNRVCIFCTIHIQYKLVFEQNPKQNNNLGFEQIFDIYQNLDS